MPNPELVELLGASPTDQQRQSIFASVGYVPTPEQARVHFARDREGNPARFRLVAGGERAGKSYSAAMEALSYLPWTDLGWIVGPDYEQTHAEFDYLVEGARALGLVDSVRRPERMGWSLSLVTGGLVETRSAADPEKLAGRPPDWVLLVEAGQVRDVTVYYRCMTRVAQKRGWLYISGTFESSEGWYPDLYQAWQSPNEDGGVSFSLPSWTNRSVYPGGRSDPEIKRLERLLPPEVFAERIAGRPMPPKCRVINQFNVVDHVREMRHVESPDPYPPHGVIELPQDCEDQLWIDPGYAGAYAVLFVSIWENTAYVYDEIYLTGYVTEQIIEIARARPRFKHVTCLIMDVSAKAHHAVKSPAEIWRAQTGLPVHMRKVGVRDGILRTNASLRPNPETGKPQLYIGTKCKYTQWEFTTGYRYPEDGSGKPLSEIPIDRNNHAAKAIAYGLVANFGFVQRDRRIGGLAYHIPAWAR